MKKRKLTNEELEKIKQIKQTNKELQEAILFNTEALRPKEVKKRNEEKEKEILVENGQISVFTQKQFAQILLKEAAVRDVTFVPEFYDHLFRLTGLKRSKENPQYKPDVFAIYTIKYVYRRFNIKNLMDELRGRNPFITIESMREFKHYQFFNDFYYNQLVRFISDCIQWMSKYDALHKFDIEYCKHYRLTTDGDLFYK